MHRFYLCENTVSGVVEILVLKLKNKTIRKRCLTPRLWVLVFELKWISLEWVGSPRACSRVGCRIGLSPLNEAEFALLGTPGGLTLSGLSTCWWHLLHFRGEGRGRLTRVFRQLPHNWVLLPWSGESWVFCSLFACQPVDSSSGDLEAISPDWNLVLCRKEKRAWFFSCGFESSSSVVPSDVSLVTC